VPARRRRVAERGLTLIEVMVVVILVAVVTTGIVAGSGQLASARLKRATTTTASAVKVAYVRATATSKSVRIVFDIDEGKIWLEEATQPMLVQQRGTVDKTGTGGSADPATEAEKVAVAEGERIIKGPQAARAAFRPVKAPGFEDAEKSHAETAAGRELGRNITLRSVQTTHDQEPKTSGRAYLYFWPGGQTERASIQLRVGTSVEDSETLSLVVSPLTGKTTVKNGPFALERAADKDGNEREDTGF